MKTEFKVQLIDDYDRSATDAVVPTMLSEKAVDDGPPPKFVVLGGKAWKWCHRRLNGVYVYHRTFEVSFATVS